MTLASLPALAQYPHTAEILEVTGRWTGTQAEVVWTTGVEYGTGGFRVYRQGADGEMPLHAGFIPADITRPAGSYAAVDAERREGEKATYRIDELRGDGTVVTLGVWDVTFTVTVVEPLIGLAQEPQAEPAFVLATEPSPTPAAKLRVVSNDVYAVSFEALADVLGLSLVEVAARAAEASLVMRSGGAPVAYWVDAPDQRLLFHGWGLKQRYTRQNVFWIAPGAPGAGLHMQRVAPGPDSVAPDQTFTGGVDFERDLVSMVEHSGALRDDLYFWTHIFSGNATIGERTLDAPLEGYAGGDVEVTVRVTGWNETPANPDHKVEVRFNDTLIGTFTLDGKADAVETFTATAAAVLVAGNVIRIRGVLQPGVISSTIVIQGFTLTYEQDYGVRAGPLDAIDGRHDRLRAVDYVDAVVLDVTDPRAPRLVGDADGLLSAGSSWPVQSGTRWLARERAAIPVVSPVPGGHGDWLRAATNAVDYLVIAPRAFAVPAQALADYRAGLGLRAAVAYYEDICDQFADGLNTPEAIRALLTHAHTNWASAPWLVVLGGWGHYDYYGAQTTAVNHLPSLLGSDSATLRPSDGLFADLTGNGVPNLAIGRIPAQTLTQFNDYLAKLQLYEGAGPQSWYPDALFIADDADAGGDFTATNLELAAETATRYTVAHTTLDSNTVAGVRTDINAAFSEGVGIMHYTGHGSYRQLASENLLHYDGVTGRVNPSLPLFISLTCLIGRFDMYLPTLRSLGEALVLEPEGGTLAVYAPSGLSWNHYAGLFGKEFYRLHAADRVDTVGPMLLRTRQSFGVLSGLHADAIRTYNLLGDPALKLRGGEGGEPPPWIRQPAQWRWERYTYAELADPVNSLAAVEAWLNHRRGSLLRFQ